MPGLECGSDVPAAPFGSIANSTRRATHGRVLLRCTLKFRIWPHWEKRKARPAAGRFGGCRRGGAPAHVALAKSLAVVPQWSPGRSTKLHAAGLRAKTSTISVGYLVGAQGLEPWTR
jgi:hypothetical protein